MTATAVHRWVEVAGELGLHARPAAEFANAAACYDAEIHLAKGPHEVNAKSVLLILTLDVRKGDVVRLSAAGPDSVAAIDDLARRLRAPCSV